MIYGIRGKIESVGLGTAEVDVNGVYYGLFIPRSLASKISAGEQKSFKTCMHVTEIEMSLYGFETREDVDMFRMLISVSGVGPKSGLVIFDENGVEEIRQAVINADVDFFKKVKGLGLKTAQKIIIELKSKIGSMKDLDLSAQEENVKSDEVYLSLVQLGFDKKSALEAMKKIPKKLETTEERLAWCLKKM